VGKKNRSACLRSLGKVTKEKKTKNEQKTGLVCSATATGLHLDGGGKSTRIVHRKGGPRSLPRGDSDQGEKGPKRRTKIKWEELSHKATSEQLARLGKQKKEKKKTKGRRFTRAKAVR